MAADTLRRVGWALIAVGLLDIGVMVYCIVNNFGYSSSFNIFAVVAGIFLLRQSMKAAHWVSFFAAFLLTGMSSAVIFFPLLIPLDLLLTQARLNPIGAVLTALMLPAVLAFLLWVYRSLTSEPVMEARRVAGVNATRPTKAFVTGAVVVLGAFVLASVMNRGSTAEIAILKAKEQTGPGYKYHITSMRWSDGSGSATVTAYNDAEIKDVHVEW